MMENHPFNNVMAIVLSLVATCIATNAGCADSAETVNIKLSNAVAKLNSVPNDEESIRYITNCLQNGTSFEKMAACRMLTKLDSSASFALPYVINIASGNDLIAKRHALTILPKIDPYSLASVDVIIRSMYSNDVVACAAIEAAGEMLVDKEKIIFALEAIQTNDTELGIMYSVKKAIEKLKRK